MAYTSWHELFSSRIGNDEGNKNTAVYSTAWSQATPSEAKMAMLVNDPNTAIFAVDVDDKIITLHSFHNFGGSVLSPANKFGALIGSGRAGSPVIVNETSLTRTLNVATPPLHTIISCLNKQEFEAVQRPAQRAAKNFSTTVSFLPAPWLLEAVLRAHTSDPALLVIAAAEAAAVFDLEHQGDPEYISSADDQLETFALWAWAVSAGKITRLIYAVDPNDEALLYYSEQRHRENIEAHGVRFAIPPANIAAAIPPVHIQPGPPPNVPMPDMYNLLNATMSRQAEALELIHSSHETNLTFQREKESKKKDRFNKFHPDTKKMITFASAPDAEAAPNVPEDTCERFINATSQGIAEQELCIQFRQMGLGEMAYATGLILNLYNGRFLYAIRNNPSNFSCFSVHEGNNVDEEEQQSRQLLLHLIEKEGKGRSVEELKALNKQILKAPSSYRDMVLQFNYFRGLCQMFFGQYSWACQAMISLIETLEKNKNSFQARARSDPVFCSKFMYAVDIRYQIWLEDCSLANRRDQVDDGALQFGTLIEMVRFGTFELALPSVFTSPAPAAPRGGDGEDHPNGKGNKRGNDDKGEGRKKKGRDRGDAKPDGAQSNKIENDEPFEEFKLKVGETWQGTFRQKNVSDRVPWGSDDDCKMCPRWYILGYCFSDCFHKASHKKRGEVPQEKIAAFNEFMALVRRGART